MPKRAIHSVSGYSVINHTNFGRSIRAIAQATLMDLLESQDFGWSDGGCFTFAHGVHSWIESSPSNIQSRMVSVISPNSEESTDHVMVELILPQGSLYIDAEGVGSKEEMLYRWDAQEHYKWENPCKMSDRLLDTSQITPILPNESKMLQRALHHHFGIWNPSILKDIPHRIEEQKKNPRIFKNIKNSGVSGFSL